MGDWFPGGGGWFGDLKPTIGPVSFPNYFKRLSLKSVPFVTVPVIRPCNSKSILVRPTEMEEKGPSKEIWVKAAPPGVKFSRIPEPSSMW
jgi:hypothetical protein